MSKQHAAEGEQTAMAEHALIAESKLTKEARAVTAAQVAKQDVKEAEDMFTVRYAQYCTVAHRTMAMW